MAALLAYGLTALACSASSGSANKRKQGNSPVGTPNAAANNSNLQAPINADISMNVPLPTGEGANRVNRRPRVKEDPSITPPPMKFSPAGEDSEIAVGMDTDGSVLEVRVFRKHPEIAKVEVRWLTPADKSFRFFLKNGQVVDIKSDRIESLRKATLRELAELLKSQRQSGVPRPRIAKTAE